MRPYAAPDELSLLIDAVVGSGTTYGQHVGSVSFHELVRDLPLACATGFTAQGRFSLWSTSHLTINLNYPLAMCCCCQDGQGPG